MPDDHHDPEGHPPVNDRIEAFLSHVVAERGLSENTVSAYRNDLSQFGEYLRSQNGGVPLAMVDRERVAGFLLSLKEREYAPATVARKVAALKSFFHYLRRAGELPLDPTEGLGSPEVKKAPPRSISAADVRSLLEQAQRRSSPDALRDIAMLRALYATGMRVTELVMLDVAHFQPQDATLAATGRGGKERTLPLDAATVRGIQEYLEDARPFLVRHNVQESSLFVNHRGQRLTRQGFWLITKALVKGTGMPIVVTPHTLRHSFASHRVGEGVALEQLRQLLGHASISTTQVYAQFAQPGREEAEAVAEAVTIASLPHRRAPTALRRAKISA